jgi:hypothetical protein
MPTMRFVRATLPKLLPIVFLAGVCLGPCIVTAATPPRIILDTDLSTDVDDAGAVAVAHVLADQGALHILAMMISSGDPWSGPCLQVLNSSSGRPEIPIGVIDNATVNEESKYTRSIAERYPNLLPVRSFPPASQLYRETLAQQPDHSVTVVTIGYLSNLSNLLNSGPDHLSPLDGTDLVRSKVKRLVCMGGEFPQGREWNLYRDAEAAAHVLQNWPTLIDFVGFEIGRRIMTGQALQAGPPNHPLRIAFQLYNNITNRESWDQAAVLVAANGSTMMEEALWAWSTPGVVQIYTDGSNGWRMDPTAAHRYVMWNAQSRKLEPLIDQLMLQATDTPLPAAGGDR